MAREELLMTREVELHKTLKIKKNELQTNTRATISTNWTFFI